ncbi:T7SS effector LXG polymorphic toxin [Peribacillus sp. NPDC097295]|uniref:T7SS effector LXG polymorphic toxin n=1 Tax=Peribacillus sp. NPDC097295 TaxID=3364402 RepID=UPI00381A78D5
MTIFEAKPLKSAVKSRAKQYEDLKGQVETLKKEFQGIVDFDEELAGAGATAIKNFYRAQVTVANAWIELFTTQISFLKGIPAILEEADLSGETVVEVPFLEGEVTHGLSNAKSMVNQQANDLQKIFQNIDDILPLTVFKQDDFHEKMEKAEKEKNTTIKKVKEVDSKLVEEYEMSEGQEKVAIGLVQALIEATSQDGTISPMNFNQSAFQASAAYQVKDEVAANMKGYREFKKQEAEARKLEKEMEELENRSALEKTLDATKTLAGEMTGYNDFLRATTGVDPVTGRKLSKAERIAAAAMAAAGFIPVIGWAGRAAKGGNAVYKTVKGLNAADHALDAYKSTKAMDILKQTEAGLYGLSAANGLGEAVTGKDMFGNELTEEQRQTSLMTALGITGIAGAAKAADKMASGTKLIPYSKEYVHNKVQKAQGTIKDMGKAIGKMEVPTGVKVREVADTTGNTYKAIGVDKTTIKDLAQKITAKGEGSKGAVEKDDYFIGTLKGEKIHLKGVKVEKIIYTKRLPEETAKLRKEFNSSVRKNFLKEFANDPVRVEYLSKAGLGEGDIDRMKDGLNPKGWQVHHNLPLDDGGTNDITNLVLINNDPYHKAVTNEQNSLTRGLAPKQSKTINWPMFEDDVYPPKPFK